MRAQAITNQFQDLSYLNNDVLAANTNSLEGSPLKNIDWKSLNEEQKAKLVLDIFLWPNLAENLLILQKAGVLDEMIPEFSKIKNLTQDERFHGKETVGEHLLGAVANIENTLADKPLFSNSRMEVLVKIAALFHDIGKNEDAENSPEFRLRQGQSAEGSGYRVEVEQKGVKRVRFVGHAGQGARVFLKRIETLQKQAGIQKLSPVEIKLVSSMIEKHMAGIEAEKNLRQSSMIGAVDQVTSDLDDVDYVNARIPLGDVVRAHLLIQGMELETSAPAEKDRLMVYWKEILKSVEERLPVMESVNRIKLTVPLVTGEDLKSFDIPVARRKAILAEIVNRQVSGELLHRKDALEMVVQMSISNDVESTRDKIQELLERGGFTKTTARLENLSVAETIVENGYKVKRYTTKPFKQYDESSTLEQIQDDINSGKFPYLVRKIAELNIPVSKIKEMLISSFDNLLQMEFFVKKFADSESILNVGKTKSTVYQAVEIERIYGSRLTKFVVMNGYQGIKDHTGIGLIHIGEQRMAELRSNYKKPNESEEQMSDRFLKDVVFHVVGTAPLEIPSDYDPLNSALLIGKAKDSPDTFAAVVINKSTDKPSIITTIYIKSSKELRKTVINYLRRLKEKSGFSDERLLPIIDNCNKFLDSLHVTLLTKESLSRDEVPPVRTEKKSVSQAELDAKKRFENLRKILGKAGLSLIIKSAQEELSKIEGCRDIEDTPALQQLLIELKQMSVSNEVKAEKIKEYYLNLGGSGG